MPEYCLQDPDLLPQKEAIISSNFVFLQFLSETRSCPLALKSLAHSLTETLPHFLCPCIYLLLGEWAGLGTGNPVTFPVLAPHASVVLVLRFPTSRNFKSQGVKDALQRTGLFLSTDWLRPGNKCHSLKLALQIFRKFPSQAHLFSLVHREEVQVDILN